jgi:hypothetical protein
MLRPSWVDLIDHSAPLCQVEAGEVYGFFYRHAFRRCAAILIGKRRDEVTVERRYQTSVFDEAERFKALLTERAIGSGYRKPWRLPTSGRYHAMCSQTESACCAGIFRTSSMVQCCGCLIIRATDGQDKGDGWVRPALGHELCKARW